MAKKATEAVDVSTDSTVISEKEISFTKSNLLRFERYRKRRDLLSALLKDGERYTIEQADALLKKFLGDDT